MSAWSVDLYYSRGDRAGGRLLAASVPVSSGSFAIRNIGLVATPMMSDDTL